MISHDGVKTRNGAKEKRKNISFIEKTAAQDESNISSEIENSTDEFEIYAAEMVKNHQPCKCTLLKLVKAGEAKARVLAYTYSFDVAKTDLIFNQLLKDGRIKLHECQTIPSREKLRRRKYYK